MPVKYLEHMLSERGVDTDPANVALKILSNTDKSQDGEIFLGFCWLLSKFSTSLIMSLNDLKKGYTRAQISQSEKKNLA